MVGKAMPVVGKNYFTILYQQKQIIALDAPAHGLADWH